MLGIFKNMKVGLRLAITFFATTILLVTVAVVGVSQLSMVRENMRTIVDKDYTNIELLNKMRDSVRFQSIAMRDIVMQEDFSFKKSELKRFRDATAIYTEAAEKLTARVSEKEVLGILAEIEKFQDTAKEMADKVLDLSLNEENEEAAANIRDAARPAQLELIANLEKLLSNFESHAKEAVTESDVIFNRSVVIISILALFAIAMQIFLAFMITRSITKPLHKAVETAKRIAIGDLRNEIDASSADELGQLLLALRDMNMQLSAIIRSIQKNANSVDKHAKTLSKSTNDVNARVQEQSEIIMAVSAAMEEINASVAEISNDAKSVLEAADATQTHVTESTSHMSSNISANELIVKTVTSSGEAIQELSTSVQQITEITEVINGIAGQTNLLALNAAIESARAGEQGRGFSVVADEVRVLAQRTAQSTADIAMIINQIRDKTLIVVSSMNQVKEQVSAGVDLNHSVAGGLTEIAQSSSTTTELAHQIACATREQAVAHNETTEHMEKLSITAEHNRASIDQIHNSADEMTNAAAQLCELVEQFKLAQ
ncbi:MAG: methyl-accepting chemotaxis protein [Gammaproteobacteria bacterium]|nr:methyl-accepting chemotaxis protein [Gammaproteobacteria bacterium]